MARWFQYNIRNYKTTIQRGAGVYFFTFVDGETTKPLYIGATIHLRERIPFQLRRFKNRPGLRVRYKVFEQRPGQPEYEFRATIRDLESRLIRRLQPIENKTGVTC